MEPAGVWGGPRAAFLPKGGLSAAILRKVPIADIDGGVEAWISDLRQLDPDAGLGPLEGFEAHVPARGPSSDVKLAQYAEIYVRRRGSRRQMQDTADAAGTSPQQMRNYIYRARKRGLLTKTTTGHGGGDLTAKAKAILKRASDRQELEESNTRRTQRAKRRGRKRG